MESDAVQSQLETAPLKRFPAAAGLRSARSAARRNHF